MVENLPTILKALYSITCTHTQKKVVYRLLWLWYKHQRKSQ